MTATVSIAPGPAINFDAWDAAGKIAEIGVAGDISLGTKWWELSQIFFDVTGVHAFGFKPGGQRNYTNFEIQCDGCSIGDRLFAQLLFGLYRDDYFDPPKEDWVRHDYDVDSVICNVSPALPNVLWTKYSAGWNVARHLAQTTPLILFLTAMT